MTRFNPLNRIQSALAALLTVLIVGSTLLSPARAADSNSPDGHRCAAHVGTAAAVDPQADRPCAAAHQFYH